MTAINMFNMTIAIMKIKQKNRTDALELSQIDWIAVYLCFHNTIPMIKMTYQSTSFTIYKVVEEMKINESKFNNNTTRL